MSDGNMTYEDWLRGCVHHDGRHGYVTLPCDEVLKIADFIERLRADRKIENSSEKPNNCEPKICDTCRYYNSNIPCGSTPSACKEADKFAEEFVQGMKNLQMVAKTEPQTDYKKWDAPPKVEIPTVNTTCVGVAMALVEDEFFREPTAEERKAVADYIDSISVPTGVNVFDLIDEPQTERSEK